MTLSVKKGTESHRKHPRQSAFGPSAEGGRAAARQRWTSNRADEFLRMEEEDEAASKAVDAALCKVAPSSTALTSTMTYVAEQDNAIRLAGKTDNAIQAAQHSLHFRKANARITPCNACRHMRCWRAFPTMFQSSLINVWPPLRIDSERLRPRTV